METRATIDRTEGTGVVASLSELVSLRPLARGIELGSVARVETLLAGPVLSPFRGRGLEFDEVRAYQAGDDVRSIDWRVTARTGRPHSKVFHEERERPTWLLADLGPSMHFGTRRAFKSVAAARAAALLAWAARDDGHRIGGIVRTPGSMVELPPRARPHHVYRLLDALARGTSEEAQESADSLAQCLARLRKRAQGGSRLVVLSDFYELDAEVRRHLEALARRCQLICVLVYDPLEAQAPPAGRYAVTDGSSVVSISSSGPGWQAWAEPLRARRETLRELCRRQRVDLLPLRTDEDAMTALSALAFAGESAARRRAS